MKTNYITIGRLIPLLAIALVAGGAMAAATYLDLQRKTHAAEASTAAIIPLAKDLQLCSVLRTIHEGGMSTAAQRLDVMVCEDIIAINSRLASLDEEDQGFIRNAFARFVLIRLNSAELLTDATQGLCDQQIEAERILAQAGAGILPPHEGIAALP